MQPPATPKNERQRLEALDELEILDTPAEAAFDALTKLAARALGVPITLVSIVDAERQWFKSRYGLEAPETKREVSFCGHVVAAEQMLVVPDAYLDERFADNPLVTGEPRVRFYAGEPLRTPDGFVLGTLCAIDHRPREISAEERETLALFAAQVVSLLELRRKRRLLVQDREALARSAARWRTLFDAMAEGVVEQGLDGKIVAHNPAALRVLGLTEEQLSGVGSMDPRWRCTHEDGSHFPGETHPAMVTLRTGEPQTNVVMGVRKPSGEQVWISVNSRPLRGGADDVLYAVLTTFRDITEMKRAAELALRLERKDRLITTGTLAAGVGHEINNPLSYVLGNIDYALEEVGALAGGSPSTRLKDLVGVLAEAREGAERVRRIVRGLRSLAREGSEPTPIDLNAVAETSVNMAMHELRQSATLVKELGQVHPVLADESRLTQVLVNLLVNAAQAFLERDPSRNRVVLKTEMREPDRVCLSVADNGPGIKPNVAPRIFDPFFTTKPLGEGTGLGLSISHGIVVSLGGELTYETRVGEGTTFTVLLPAATLPEVSDWEKSFDTQAHGGRVLLIDDEEATLRAAARLLSRVHSVTTISDPREALGLFQAGTEFDVVFCDLMMPHLTGAELYKQVAACAPSQAARFVFMSGGVIRDEIDRFLAQVPNERIEKPYSSQNLMGIASRYAALNAPKP